MGGAVSAGQNNEELVDNLCQEGYIHQPRVEKVFRMIDRADYMIFGGEDEDERLEAYEDHAWRRGTLHLSAPCIYTKALEALRLNEGVSFLNIGSGTGYLSTMAGLLIGPYGVNHGIEIYPDNVDYAYEKLTEFHDKSQWYDPVTFCDPLFVVGNGLLLSPGNILYDRIYCGAACPPEHAQLMKNMLTVGGILVMPHDDQLESVERVSQTEWKVDVVLPSVSFAPLILPSQESVKDLEALEIAVQPHTLKEYCRLAVLKDLGRERYHRIADLPLPKHLQDYISHFREWGAPSPPVKTICPIDPDKLGKKWSEGGDDSNKEGDGERKRRRNHPGPRGRPRGEQVAHAVHVNGRKVLLCNFNGIIFQIPVDSDDGDNAHSSDEDRPDSDLEEAAASDDDMNPPATEKEGGSNGLSKEKERLDEDSEQEHSDDEGDGQEMDQSESSNSDLADSMEQNDGGENSKSL